MLRVHQHTEVMSPDGKIKKTTLPEKDPITVPSFVEGYKIDYVKGKVALDVEWNSKDQTYDRDLYAFRTFHECGLVDVAVLITRSAKLNPVFDITPLLDKAGQPCQNADGTYRLCKQKYGASTTWMGKLLYRLNAGRQGGCPVLVFGIRPDVIVDWQTK